MATGNRTTRCRSSSIAPTVSHSGASADRRRLTEWAERKIAQSVSRRVQRYMRALADMPVDERLRFLTVALLYHGGLYRDGLAEILGPEGLED